MANVGAFDPLLRDLAWFDDLAAPEGWFTDELIDVGGGTPATATPSTVAAVASVPAPTVTTVFEPTDIAGLQIWLRADGITGLVDNDPVVTWADESGQANDFDQSSATARPLYKENIVGSLPVVRFDGVDNFMTGGDLSAAFPSAATLFAVWKPNSDTGYSVYRTHINDAWWRFTDGNGYFGAFRTTRITGYPTGMPSTGMHYLALVSDGSGYQVWLDGSAASAQAAGYSAGTAHDIGGSPGNSARWLDGDVCEIIAYDAALTTTQRQSVENYLAGKWLAATTASPATVAAVAAVSAPTVLAAARPTPATVAAVAAVPAPTVGAGALTAPATVAAVAAVPAPSARGAAIATPSTVAAVASVPAPTVLVGGNATATPATVAATAAVPSPTIQAAAVTSPATVAAVAAVPAPTTRAASLVAPSTVAAIASVPAPTVLTGGAGDVAHDAASESAVTTSVASYNWTHSPAGTPRGVLIFTFWTASSNGNTAVTYGGVNVPAVPGGYALDSAGEVGDAKAWFLGESIPTGAQTVEVTRTNDTNASYAIAITVAGTTDTEATGVVLLQGDGTLAEQSVTDGSPGSDSTRYAGLQFGAATVPPAGANSTLLHDAVIPASRTASAVRETTPGEGARDVGYASGTTDDRAGVHLAIRQLVAVPALATPATVAAVSAVPAATILAAAQSTPSTVAAVAAVPAPTTRGTAVAAPTTVAAIAAVPAPTPRGAAVASPTTVGAIASVPAPSILAGGSVTVSPATVAAVAAVPSPATQGVGVVGPATVAAVAAVPPATVRGGAITTPVTVAASASVPAPGITAGGSVTVSPATVAALASVPVPVLAAIAGAAPATVAALASIGSPTVTGTANIVVSTVAAFASVNRPVLMVPLTISRLGPKTGGIGTGDVLALSGVGPTAGGAPSGDVLVLTKEGP